MLFRITPDQRPVIHGEEHLHQWRRKFFAAGRHVLRVGALHRVDARSQIAAPVVDPRERRLDRRHVAPRFLRVVQLVDRLVVELEAEQRANDVLVRRQRRVGQRRVIGRRVDDQAALRRAPVEVLQRQAAVVAVQVVSRDQRISRLCERRLVQPAMRAPAPVQPRRPVIGAREMGRRRFEHPDRLRVRSVLVRPPADLPCRALRVVTGRILLVHLAESRIRGLVVVADDVVARQVVERFFRPALVGELGDDPADRARVFGIVAELARRDGVEEQRFALPRRLVDVWPDAVARVALALQVVVAFGEPQVDQLAIVDRGGAPQRFVQRARLRIALRAEEALGAADFELVPVRARFDRGDG